MLREWYLHPNGQIPAYEWNFSDVNPPVHAWAALRVFELDGGSDYTFLSRVFHKLLMNFTWWTNNKDHGDNNLFEGGFMGLDNIAPIDRSKIPADLGYLEQADSTAWMAMYALDLLAMAVRLALHDRSYEDVAVKFFEHFLAIANAANNAGLWDEDDAYFYDVLHLTDGRHVPIKVRSLVGLVPITAAVDIRDGLLDQLPEFAERAKWFVDTKPRLATALHVRVDDGMTHRLLCLVSPERLKRVLEKMFDEQRLLSPFGIRSLSAWHRDHPFAFTAGDLVAVADYQPAESTSALFGGNSNWRGRSGSRSTRCSSRRSAITTASRTAPSSWSIRPAPECRSHWVTQRPTSSGGWCRSSSPGPTGAVRSTAATTCSPLTRAGGTTSRSTSISTATPVLAWVLRIRPAGPR